MPSERFTFNTIGVVNSPFKEKFGIPRQPRIATHATGQVILTPPFNSIESVKGLEQFSHLWLTFIFHQNLDKGWKALVRPPRLGGNKKIGVFASRSTFRPNALGLSVVKLDGIVQSAKEVIINISELDLMDGTPILDIKPYIPYSDCIDNAFAGYASSPPNAHTQVNFTDEVKARLIVLEKQYNNLTMLVKQILEQDPRPAYKKEKQDYKEYGLSLYELNIKWKVVENTICVFDVESL